MAAILTITGYSVNDTIVIFDRVRENMRVDAARTAGDRWSTPASTRRCRRTLITAGTTFLSVLALFLFGGEALRGFSFTMLVGVISGTYSTVFIASAIAILLSKKPQAAVAAPAPAQAERKPRPQGQGRKACVPTSVLTFLSRGAAGSGPGAHRVSAHFVHRPPAARCPRARLRRPGRRVHRDDPARRRSWR